MEVMPKIVHMARLHAKINVPGPVDAYCWLSKCNGIVS